MTRRRKLFWFAITAGFVVAVYFVFRPGIPKHNINPASFQKIKEGMTLAEVEAIFGVPAGVYTTRPYKRDVHAEDALEWVGDEGALFVWFDQETKTVHRCFSFMPETGLTWFERFQIWLGLREKPPEVVGQPGGEWSN